MRMDEACREARKIYAEIEEALVEKHLLDDREPGSDNPTLRSVILAVLNMVDRGQEATGVTTYRHHLMEEGSDYSIVIRFQRRKRLRKQKDSF
ncbi:hypothetical protein [Bacillus thuringiensis]|nr:hypothetical protein [Bacillus thuringiensis]